MEVQFVTFKCLNIMFNYFMVFALVIAVVIALCVALIYCILVIALTFKGTKKVLQIVFKAFHCCFFSVRNCGQNVNEDWQYRS
jgi:hypothetical protein